MLTTFVVGLSRCRFSSFEEERKKNENSVSSFLVFFFFFFFYGSEGVRAGWRGVLQQLHMVRGLPNAVIISPLRWKRTTRWMTYRSHSTADCNLLRLNWWSGNATQTLTHTKQKITQSHNNTKSHGVATKEPETKKERPK